MRLTYVHVMNGCQSSFYEAIPHNSQSVNGWNELNKSNQNVWTAWNIPNSILFRHEMLPAFRSVERGECALVQIHIQINIESISIYRQASGELKWVKINLVFFCCIKHCDAFKWVLPLKL